MRYLFVFLLLVSQGVASQALEVIDSYEYVVGQLLLDAGKGGIGLGATVKTIHDPGRYELEITQIDGPDIIVNGVNLGPLKSIKVDVYTYVTSRSGNRIRILAGTRNQPERVEIGEIEVWGAYPGGVTTAIYKVILPEGFRPRSGGSGGGRGRSNSGGSRRSG
ncbi:hypothetical protein FGF1_17180 [Flavobacteriaceae bacterium GF1]